MKPAMFSTLFNSLTCKAPVEWLEPPWPSMRITQKMTSARMVPLA